MELQSKRHNPLTFYLRILMYMFIALMIRVFCLLPLAALFIFEAGDPLRWLALLCPVLHIFLVMPLRYSFAEALVQERGSRYFSFDKAFSLSSYFSKLGEGILHFFSVLKWLLPVVPLALYVKKYFSEMWATEVLSTISNLGLKAKEIWDSVANFFLKLFGKEPLAASSASLGLMEGIYVILGVVALLALIFLIGVMRNSSTRYIWAVAHRDGLPVRKEVRRRIRGHRIEQLLVALMNLILLAPFFYIIYKCFKPVITEVSNSALSIALGQDVNIPFGLKNILILVGSFFGVYMTLLPARRILTAAFASRQLRHTVRQNDELDFPGAEELEEDVSDIDLENLDLADQPMMQQPMMQQPMMAPIPIEGMTAVPQMVDGQMQYVYMPADANALPPATVPQWAQAENDGTAIPETPVIPASFLANESAGSDLDA